MSWYTRQLESSGCTFWGTSGIDDFGNTQFSSPVYKDCRWEDKQELFRDDNGNEVMSEAVILLGSSVDIEGYLYHGTSSGSDPTSIEGAKEIRQYSEIPDIKRNNTLYKAWL